MDDNREDAGWPIFFIVSLSLIVLIFAAVIRLDQ